MSIGAKWSGAKILINGRFYTRYFFDRDSFPRVKEKHAPNKKSPAALRRLGCPGYGFSGVGCCPPHA